jgi:polysaccharide biosynthesis/export protein
MKLLTMLSGVALLCSSAFAQQPYVHVIVPGDLLHVQVFDTPTMDQTARVNDDGSFDLLIGGTVHLASLTLDQATRAVEARLIEAQIMYHPHVLVTSVEHDAQNVTVSGQVARPGPYQLDIPRSVLDAIASSGGLTDVADRHILIQRGNSGKMVQYFVSNEGDQNAADAPMVFPGDRVIVNRAPVSYVLGDVAKPGGYLTIGNDSKLTVLQIVSQAGGTQPSAVPSHAKLIRPTPGGGYTVIPLQISDMAKGKKPDMLLQPNDIVYIPFSYLRNALSNISQLFAAATSASIYAAH